MVGVTGAAGETILLLLDERNFPINNLYPLASTNSAGKQWSVQGLATFDFPQAQVSLFSAGGAISEKKYAPIIEFAYSAKRRAKAIYCALTDHYDSYKAT